MPVPALVAARPTVPGPARSTSSTASLPTHVLRKVAVNPLVLVLTALVLVAHPTTARQGTAPAPQAPVVSPEITHVAAVSTRIRSALTIARNQKGDPYRYGASGPNAFDCSGLVYYATHRAG